LRERRARCQQQQRDNRKQADRETGLRHKSGFFPQFCLRTILSESRVPSPVAVEDKPFEIMRWGTARIRRLPRAAPG
jgi:hypothetical protein